MSSHLSSEHVSVVCLPFAVAWIYCLREHWQDIANKHVFCLALTQTEPSDLAQPPQSQVLKGQQGTIFRRL